MKRSVPLAPRRRAMRPAGVLAIFFVCLLFLSIVFAAVLALQNARSDSPADDTLPSGTPDDKAPDADTAVTLSKIDGVSYVAARAVGTDLRQLSETVFSLTLSDGKEYCFCAGLTDYFCGQTLGFLPNAPIVTEGELYLPVNLDALPLGETPDAADVSACVLPAQTRGDAPRLPAETDALAYFSQVTESPEFSLDLSEYENSMQPAERDAYLVLANATHSLDADYVPEDLLYVERARYSDPGVRARLIRPAALALDAFLKEAYANGYDDVTVTSGYRSYGDQEYRFNLKVSSIRSRYGTLEEAQNAAATVIQWPGKSEHQTGLACDMHNLPSADTAFGETEAAKWMHENAHLFGFILRYPEDKTEITGISYEPWHFRYVGRYHATRMYLLNLTLEEYVEFLDLNEVIA